MPPIPAPPYYSNLTPPRIAPDSHPFAVGGYADPPARSHPIGIAFGAGSIGGHWEPGGRDAAGNPVSRWVPPEKAWSLTVGGVRLDGRWVARDGRWVELAEDA